MNKNSVRYLILSILSEYPEGLTFKKLTALAKQKKAISLATQSVLLSNARKTHIVKVVSGVVCEHCGSSLLVYALTKKGMDVVKEVAT